MGYFARIVHRNFFYGADSDTLAFARGLRKKMTKAEKILWEHLRKKRFRGYTFRRQHSIKFYIADFYCHQLRLVIEVDGSVHDVPEVREHDLNRDAEIKRLGLTVIRFTNREVCNDIGSVLERIGKVEEGARGVNSPPPPAPPPGGRGER